MLGVLILTVLSNGLNQIGAADYTQTIIKGLVIIVAAVYAALGVFHYFLRHRFLTISFHPEEAERLGWKIKWWDFLFYLSFGVVITLAVPVAGVLMVFSFLVVPAVIAFLFSRDMRRLSHRPRIEASAPEPQEM